MSHTGENGPQAAKALLARARAMHGLGPVILPGAGLLTPAAFFAGLCIKRNEEPSVQVSESAGAGGTRGLVSHRGDNETVLIRDARMAEFPALQGIDLATGQMFCDIGMPEIADYGSWPRVCMRRDLPGPAGPAG